VKYSIIDWDTKDRNTKVERRRFSFTNSQVILGYKFRNKLIGDKMTTFYAAYLINTAAGRHKVTRRKKANQAWYVGFSMGELRQQWDWSLNANYQWVQAQATPDFDTSAIGRGNASGIGLYSSKKNGKGTPIKRKDGKFTPVAPVGPGNFQGVSVEIFLMFSKSITLYQAWRHSITLDTSMSPRFSYKQYELELIYAF